MRNVTALLLAGLTLLVGSRGAQAYCPFCSAVSQTLRQEMKSMDAVVIGEVVGVGKSETDAEFKVLEVLKGDELVQAEDVIQAAYFGSAPKGTKFLMMGVDPPAILWSSPLPVSAKAIDFIKQITQLPDALDQQLEFYLQYLEHPEQLMARDAYDEFAQAPYTSIQGLKPKLDREKLLGWIQDVNLPADRKRLYLVMLGIAGKQEDAELIEKMLRSDDPNQRAGLDAMIACYVTLKGADGLALVDELFLGNKKSQYADTYSAIMALRFHGTEGNVVDKQRVLKSMHLILERPELADLVIPDLARWEDWSQIDRLVTLFKTADDKSSWVRVPVINYLRACPLPEAVDQLKELERIDPAAFKRATSFFPVPQPAAPTPKQSSSREPRSGSPAAGLAAARPAAAGKFTMLAESSRRGELQLAGAVPMLAVKLPPVAASAPLLTSLSNFAVASCVIAMAAVTAAIAMWLSLTGAGSPSAVAYAWARVANRSSRLR
jgi:hypothetical protein